jgi:D-hexose-6-phosphate mutarotase
MVVWNPWNERKDGVIAMAHLVRMVVVAYVMFLTVKLCVFDTWM